MPLPLSLSFNTHSVEAHWLVADMIYTYRVTALLRHKPDGFGLTHIHMHDGVEVFWQVLL